MLQEGKSSRQTHSLPDVIKKNTHIYSYTVSFTILFIPNNIHICCIHSERAIGNGRSIYLIRDLQWCLSARCDLEKGRYLGRGGGKGGKEGADNTYNVPMVSCKIS